MLLNKQTWHTDFCAVQPTLLSATQYSYQFYSSCLCFILYITIVIQKKILPVIQFQFFYMPISNHYNIQSLTGTQCNRQPARHKHTPRTCTLHGQNIFTHMSRKNMPIPTPTQTQAWNIAKLPQSWDR